MTRSKDRDYKILIFCDKPMGLKGLGTTFWEAGWDVAFALDRESFLKRIKMLSFDLIIVNTGVKDLGFKPLWNQLRSGDKEAYYPPVIALIPSDSGFDPGYWLNEGLADYVRENGGGDPWNYGEILARAANHLKIRKQERLLKQKILKLEKSNNDKDNFYRILSHDLKAPFQGLVGLLEVLHGEFDSLTRNEVQNYIRNVHDSTKRTYRLLENLLEWSGLQGGQLKWTPEEMELSLLVDDVLGFFRIGARDKGITLSSDVEPGLTIFADRRMISSVIRNLVYNSIKFTNRNGSILVRAKESVDYYEISVDDTGVGVQPDNLNKLLRNGEADTTPGTAQESGSGLGLKICKQFIQMNGGQLWVRSDPDRGSSFLFSLPKRKVDLSIIGESSLQLIGRRRENGKK